MYRHSETYSSTFTMCSCKKKQTKLKSRRYSSLEAKSSPSIGQKSAILLSGAATQSN